MTKILVSWETDSISTVDRGHFLDLQNYVESEIWRRHPPTSCAPWHIEINQRGSWWMPAINKQNFFQRSFPALAGLLYCFLLFWSHHTVHTPSIPAYTVWVKKSSPPKLFAIFSLRLSIFLCNFVSMLSVHIYTHIYQFW